jgi:hypothetical protein
MNIERRRHKDRRGQFAQVNEERRHGEGRRKADEDRRRIRLIRECLLVRALGRERWGTPDRATVWLAIAQGWYEGRPLNVSAVAALAGCSRQTVMRHIATLKKQGAVDTRHNDARSTIIIPLRGHGATRAFFDAVEAAMRRGGYPRRRSETDT